LHDRLGNRHTHGWVAGGPASRGVCENIGTIRRKICVISDPSRDEYPIPDGAPSEMTTAETYEFLTSVFRQVFGRDDINLRSDMTAADLIGWDSIAHVDLLIEIETRLGIDFEPEEIDQLRRVGDL